MIFLSFSVFFSVWDGNTYFCYSGKFSHGEKQHSVPKEWKLMKSRFLSKLCDFLRKNGTCCDGKGFFFISKVIWRYFLSLTVPLIRWHNSWFKYVPYIFNLKKKATNVILFYLYDQMNYIFLNLHDHHLNDIIQV